MSLLKRLFGKSEHPYWASFLSQSDYHQFVRDLTQVLDKVAKPYTLDLPNCCWRSDGDPDNLYGLVNMAQTWRQVDVSDRKTYLEGFIASLLNSRDLMGKDYSFEEIKEQLRVRLYPLDIIESAPVKDLKICDAFVTMIAVDFPETIQSATEDQIRDWGFEGREDELYKLALDLTWKNESVSVSSYELPAGISIRVVNGDSFFTSSHALLMDRYLVPANPKGALVIIPHRHTFAFYSIEDRKGLEGAIQAILPMAQGMFEEGPGSVTPELLWWRDGKFAVISAPDGGVDIPEELRILLVD